MSTIWDSFNIFREEKLLMNREREVHPQSIEDIFNKIIEENIPNLFNTKQNQKRHFPLCSTVKPFLKIKLRKQKAARLRVK